MMWRDGEILTLRRNWGPPGRRCAELVVRVTAAPSRADSLQVDRRLRAIAYETVTGIPGVGEEVRMDVSALDRGLGTGGHAMVVARPGVLPEGPVREGHLVKARYMPDQVMVTGVDVIADLHSALPAILAGARATRGAHDQVRAVYVMTDGGALPLAYSRTVAALRRVGWLAGTVTSGQAWGGDVEAVSVHNALLAARHVLGADLVVLAQGPGNLGTDTPWGFSGVACGDAVNAVAVLGGRAIACLRVSQADARERHRGISHHSMTAYGRVALTAADIVVPGLPGALGEQIDAQARELCGPRPRGARHHRVDTGVDGLTEVLEEAQNATGIRLSTMGRGLHEDTAAFLAAAAAGRYAETLLHEQAPEAA